MPSLDLLLANENAGLDIYEAKDLDSWVNGQVSLSRVSLIITSVIFIIIYIFILIFSSSMTVKLVSFGIMAVILSLMAASTFYITPKFATNQYKRYENEVEGTMRALNISRGEAVRTIREERLQRETTGVMREQANAMRTSRQPGLGQGLSAGVGFGIANAVFNRK